MNGITPATALWYASRATGVVALLMLTLVMILGIVVNRQGHLPGLPRFAVTGLHRNLSLLSVAFVAAHVLTAVADTYVTIPLAAAVVPFSSPYERFWLGIGAISLDLMIAVIVTSLLRSYLGRAPWRAVHWLAYVLWPTALAHSIGSGADLRHGALLDFALGCAFAVAVALIWRLVATARALPRAQRAGALLPDRGGRVSFRGGS
jgi:methionine sulfoxide reductase heme-binding subunit